MINEALLVHLVLYITIVLIIAVLACWAIQKWAAQELKQPLYIATAVIAACLIILRLLGTI